MFSGFTGNTTTNEAELIDSDEDVTICSREYNFAVDVALVNINSNLVSPNITATADGDDIDCELKFVSCEAGGIATHECKVQSSALRGESSITVEVRAQLASQESRQINTFNLKLADATKQTRTVVTVILVLIVVIALSVVELTFFCPAPKGLPNYILVVGGLLLAMITLAVATAYTLSSSDDVSEACLNGYMRLGTIVSGVVSVGGNIAIIDRYRRV